MVVVVGCVCVCVCGGGGAAGWVRGGVGWWWGGGGGQKRRGPRLEVINSNKLPSGSLLQLACWSCWGTDQGATGFTAALVNSGCPPPTGGYLLLIPNPLLLLSG
jgi:hypothetical protein